MSRIPAKGFLKQILLPPLALAGIDLVAGVVLYGHTSNLWLFKNTHNWASVAATLAFTEGILCIIIGAVTGWGGRMDGQKTIIAQESGEAEVDVKKYVEERERNMGWGFRLIANGAILILLTMVIGLAS
jgi:hypothetical protein